MPRPEDPAARGDDLVRRPTIERGSREGGCRETTRRKAEEGTDPLEGSWVLQGNGAYGKWGSGDEVDPEPAPRAPSSAERPRAPPAAPRGAPAPGPPGAASPVPPRPALTPELLAWLEERVARCVTAAVHQALHDALARERDALRVQREALVHTARALEEKRQQLEARREGLRAAEARLALRARRSPSRTGSRERRLGSA